MSRSDIISLHHKTVACLFFIVGEVIDKLLRSNITSLYHKTVACLFFIVGEIINKHHFLCSPLQAL